VAVSDDQGRVATPIETIIRSRGDRAVDHRAMAKLVDDWEAGVVVVGLPLLLDGRFTTVTADRQLRQQGVRGKSRTAVIDRAAAAVLLQSWLDRHRSESPGA